VRDRLRSRSPHLLWASMLLARYQVALAFNSLLAALDCFRAGCVCRRVLITALYCRSLYRRYTGLLHVGFVELGPLYRPVGLVGRVQLEPAHAAADGMAALYYSTPLTSVHPSVVCDCTFNGTWSRSFGAPMVAVRLLQRMLRKIRQQPVVCSSLHITAAAYRIQERKAVRNGYCFPRRPNVTSGIPILSSRTRISHSTAK
jgi:hypothetical protein